MTKRSAQLSGVLIICLGVLLALPFRHHSPRPIATAREAGDPSSELDLQLPQSPLTVASTPNGASPPSPSPSVTPPKLQPISQSDDQTKKPLVAAHSRPTFQLRERPIDPTASDSRRPAGDQHSVAAPLVPKRPPSAPDPDQRPSKHFLVDGDTLPNLAERYLGSASRHAEILRANPQLDPELLPLRSWIVIPAKFQPAASTARPRTKLVPID